MKQERTFFKKWRDRKHRSSPHLRTKRMKTMKSKETRCRARREVIDYQRRHRNSVLFLLLLVLLPLLFFCQLVDGADWIIPFRWRDLNKGLETTQANKTHLNQFYTTFLWLLCARVLKLLIYIASIGDNIVGANQEIELSNEKS